MTFTIVLMCNALSMAFAGYCWSRSRQDHEIAEALLEKYRNVLVRCERDVRIVTKQRDEIEQRCCAALEIENTSLRARLEGGPYRSLSS